MSEKLVASEVEFDQIDVDSLPMVILITAPTWCAPCRAFEPHWKKAVEQMPNVTFVKIDTGSSPEDTGQHWASRRFNVMGVPFVFMVDKDGGISVIKSRAVVPLMKEIAENE